MSNAPSAPSITIGLVVRNGAKHLAQAIESLQRQTRTDFVLKVYDNASTDATAEIVADFAQRDPRILLHQHETDVGWRRNFIFAAERADTEFFCWATHDDLHDERFLEHLQGLLRQHPDAGLACCAVRNMDPDGTLRNIRRETASLSTTQGMTAVQRQRMHLRDLAGTPFYGLFRTRALQETLSVLRAIAAFAGPPMPGVDMIFISAFLRGHGLAVTHKPLLLFRRGGWSHQRGVYGSLANYARQIWRFDRAMADATRRSPRTFWDALILGGARRWSVGRYLLSQPMRAMTWHYLTGSMPFLARLHDWVAARTQPAFRRVRRRIRALPPGASVAVLGAGKHTQRWLRVIRGCIEPHARLCAILDDAAEHDTHLGGVPVIRPASSVDPINKSVPIIHGDRFIYCSMDVILVSSDAYEAALFRRARQIAPSGTKVWCLYDLTLEHEVSAASIPSVSAMNSSNSSSASREPSARETLAGRAA